MTTELTILTWMLVLAIVQIFLPAMWRNRETGLSYNAGPRDGEGPPVGVITGRLQRAQKNLFETLPLFIAAVLIAHVADLHETSTVRGVWLYFIGRLAYLPLYAFGVPYVRSLAWMISMVGLALILSAILSL